MMTKQNTVLFYFNSKAEIVINESDTDNVFELIFSTTIQNIQKYLENYWLIIDLAIDHNINISKYDLLAGSSYIKIPKELYHPKKGVINI